MKKWTRRALVGAGSIVLAAAVAAVAVYASSQSRLNRVYDVAGARLAVSADPATVERGRHLATALAKCADCHGEDLGGQAFFEDGAIGYLSASNLTSGKGGILGRYDDRQLDAAIRGGVAADGRPLVYMPSQEYQHLSDEDAAALIAYLRSLPPVDREHPAPRIGPVGRALLVTGKMKLLPAELIDHRAPARSAPAAPGVSREYGEYLVQVGGCFSCHGPDLAGGLVNGPPGTPPSTNVTPGGIGHWSEADWIAAMRTGRRPDGSVLSDAMPWKAMARMTDDELRAMWTYLRSVPAVEPAAER
jgi:mono/diheme cytochrome c family protein